MLHIRLNNMLYRSGKHWSSIKVERHITQVFWKINNQDFLQVTVVLLNNLSKIRLQARTPITTFCVISMAVQPYQPSDN